MKSNSFTLRPGRLFHAGFTLIEMVVAVGLLVVVMLGVGVIFKGATDAAGQSERTLDMLSNVRSIQSQIDRDVAALDKNCFLVIRSAYYPFVDSTGVNVNHRCDLVSFISYGSFHHRTGGISTSPFTDNNTVTPSAFITWGQLAMEKSAIPAGSDYISSDQSQQLSPSQTPTGYVTTPTGINEGGMTLGRNVMLLAPQNTGTKNVSPNGLLLAAYENASSISAIDYGTASVAANSTFDTSPTTANITQSRIDLAAATPAQIMNILQQNIGTIGGSTSYEADHFCYRHGTVASVYDGQNVVNAYFRMTPIALQGVSSFSVEWTDGVSVYGAGDTDPITGTTVDPNYVGTTKWFGLGNPDPKYASWTNGSPRQLTSDAGSDPYAVVFSYDTLRANWPVALRFRFHVADPTGRLPGGRDFTQIVKLPY